MTNLINIKQTIERTVFNVNTESTIEFKTRINKIKFNINVDKIKFLKTKITMFNIRKIKINFLRRNVKMTTNIIKGDSSEIYIFESPDVVTFDQSWVANFAVAATLGGTAILSGALSKNEANTQFILQLTPAQTAQLTEGSKYWLIVEIKQLGGSPLSSSPEVLLFRREVMQEQISIKPQGIV